MKKPLSGIIFTQNSMRQVEKEKKKILVPNSVHSRPGQETSEKNGKKIQKIKKPLSTIIFCQNGMRQAEKERKKFQFRIPFILDTGKKILKKIAKKLKKLKNLFPALFLDKSQAEKARKKFSPEFRSYSTRARKFRKKWQKNSKN